MIKNNQEIDINLVGICGLYCGACDNYLAFNPNHDHLLLKDKFLKKKENEYCTGCNSNKVSLHCSKCKMRICAKNQNIISCGYCSKYPCKEIFNFKSESEKLNGAKHRKDIMTNTEELVKSGEFEWLKKQQEKWTCECGKAYSFYEEKCSNCGVALKSYS